MLSSVIARFVRELLNSSAVKMPPKAGAFGGSGRTLLRCGLRAPHECLQRQPARYRSGDLRAEVEDALVEEPVPHEVDQITELVFVEPDRLPEQRVDTGREDAFERAHLEVGGGLVGLRVMAARRANDVKVVSDGRLDRADSAVVEKGRGDFEIPQGRRAEHVPLRGIVRGLFDAEIFMFVRAIEDDVARTDAKLREELWSADAVQLEVAEHLVRQAGHGVAGDTPGLAEEQKRAALLAPGHRVLLTPGKSVERRIRGGEGGLELGDGAPPHADGDATRW